MPRNLAPKDITEFTSFSYPSLSPKGDLVAVSLHRADTEKDEYISSIWLVDVTDRKVRRFTYGSKDYSSVLSAYGLYIALGARRDLGKDEKRTELYIISATS